MRTSSGPVSFESRYSACAISFRDDQLVACSFSRALVKSNLEPRANRRLPFCESKSYWPYACVLLRSYADFLSYPPWSHIILVTFRSEAGFYKLKAARYRACASPRRIYETCIRAFGTYQFDGSRSGPNAGQPGHGTHVQ